MEVSRLLADTMSLEIFLSQPCLLTTESTMMMGKEGNVLQATTMSFIGYNEQQRMPACLRKMQHSKRESQRLGVVEEVVVAVIVFQDH